MQLPHPNVHCLASALLLAALLGSASTAYATDADVHRHELAVALRQIEALDRFIATVAPSYQPAPGQRYHFDYARLREDVQRVRAGIHDYLTPPRAQPRDPVELLGDYRRFVRSSDAEEPR